MLCSASEASHYAHLLISGYPNSALAEPEYYITQVVGVMIQFEHDIVRDACKPSGLPASEPKFLPTVGTLTNYLTAQAASAGRKKHYSSLLLTPSGPQRKLTVANLFIAEDVPHYDKITERAKGDPDNSRYEENHACSDGRIRNGYWVPWPWYDEVKSRPASSFSPLPEK
jgi:hypothetical protein